MGSRISICGPVEVVDAASKPVRDARRLRRFDGLAPDGETLLEHLDGPLDDVGLEGGELVLAHKAGGVVVETVWRSPRALSAAERAVLLDYTTGQWSDGVGENFAGELGERFGLEVDLLPDPDRVTVSEKSAKTAAPGGGAKLLAAVKNGKRADVERLLDGGADLEARNKWKQTALIVAIFNEQPDLALLLLERGADPNALAEDGRRPLQAAAMVGMVAVAEALLERGARPDDRDDSEMSARDWAVNREHAKVVELLDRKGTRR